jgi:outer membrane protein OmpA-like peptidoglycan-associated protein
MDTDGDGIPDGIEDANKNGQVDPGETDPTKADSDGDGILDGLEDANQNGKVDPGETDPTKTDSDGDGLPDGLEDKNKNGKCDPGETCGAKKDSDGDGIDDGKEDKNKNGKLDPGESDPTKADTDGDGIPDGIEDANHDGSPDANETHATKADTDGDGIPDGVEDKNKNGKVDPGETDPKKKDSDGDGLDDKAEDKNGNGKVDPGETDPTKADSDGDGISDGDEVAQKRDPLAADVSVEGGGCTAGRTTTGGWWLVALAVGLLLVRRRFAMPWRTALFVVPLIAAAFPVVARADVPANQALLRMLVPVSQNGGLHNEGAQVLGHKQASAGLLLHYDHRPLTVYDSKTKELLYDEVGRQIWGQVLIGYGLFDKLEFGLALPIALSQGGDARPSYLGKAPALAAGLGDARINLKFQFVDAGALQLAVAGSLAAPTGNSKAYLGDGGIGGNGALLAGLDFGRIVAFGDVGWRLRPLRSGSLPGSTLVIKTDDALQGGAGVRWIASKEGLHTKLEFVGEWAGALTFAQAGTRGRTGEVAVAARIGLPADLMATIGGTVGLGRAPGTPQFRALAGITWSPPAFRDQDGDGLHDDLDKCPDKSEDKDGWQDEDGCPDPDDDGDGIPDTADKCPRMAEDKDGFKDDDGCPDADNDDDGIADVYDKCPLQPEDKDGWQDEDGCPDPDDDGDGILDADDKCRRVKGVASKAGCPIRDMDGDGIEDDKDKCPKEPETFNGIDDDDGCPEKVKAIVEVTDREIRILQKVYFETGKAEIKPISFQVLDAVAGVLRTRDDLTKIEIQGHTDDVGDDRENLELSDSRARSVARYLWDKGIASGRLDPKGYGETAPICQDVAKLEKAGKKQKKALEACREQNRRVEFQIREIMGKKVEEPKKADATDPDLAPAQDAAKPEATPAKKKGK